MNAATRKLQRQWYAALAESGFDDIELDEHRIRPDCDPRTKLRAFEDREARESYYSEAEDFLRTFDFKKERHRDVWALHAQGASVRESASVLGIDRNKVWRVLERIKKKFMVVRMSQALIRPYRITDKDFVQASWLHSYKHSSQFAKRINHDVYYRAHGEITDGLLSRCGATTLVATLPDEQDIILGYLVMETGSGAPIVHYCFVKKEWRHLGIAKSLAEYAGLTETLVYFSHWTAPIDSIFNKRYLELTYDPYRI